MTGQSVALVRSSASTASLKRPHGGLDWALAGVAILLLLLGLVMISSASMTPADRVYGDPFHFFWRQLAHVAVGVLAAALALRLPLPLWSRLSLVLFGLGLLGLVLVLLPGVGREVNGSMRWMDVGGFSIQPSEFIKIAMILYVASYLARRGEEIRTAWRGFARPLVVLGAVVVLLLLEPDYGASVVLSATIVGMLFLGGVPLGRFLVCALAMGALFGLMVVLAPYRLERLWSFQHPWADPFGSGFQLTQALIAIGRGEWFGVGLGSSVQKLFYLPEAHTDFLFAVLAEELGFVGILLVVSAFAFIVWRAFLIARRAERMAQPFAAYTAYGLGLLLGLQGFINIGVNLGVLPTKGLTLPLMSYGGSSMVASCLSVGLLLRVDLEARRTR
ncbi:MAG: putative lipid II flippase FtsW [Gammaproteobacteria bacterium]